VILENQNESLSLSLRGGGALGKNVMTQFEGSDGQVREDRARSSGRGEKGKGGEMALRKYTETRERGGKVVGPLGCRPT